mgnify:FL=1
MSLEYSLKMGLNRLLSKTPKNSADEQYLTIGRNILANGVYKNNRTGVGAYSLPHQIMQFNLDDEFPILTSKFVGLKTAVKELLWIWQDQSNDVNLLNQKYGVTIWDEWKRNDGTIGQVYGYQLGCEYKYFDVDYNKALELKDQGKIKNIHITPQGVCLMNQVDKLIYDLTYNPDNRRMVVSLWNVEDLHNMALQPCAFLTQWNVTKDKLNLLLNIRSNDFCLGNPYNMCQYAFLLMLMAHVTGYKPGLFTIMINDCHVYENHVQGLIKQLNQETYYAPEVRIKSGVKSFYDFRIGDLIIEDYNHGGKISFEVAV